MLLLPRKKLKNNSTDY